MTTIQELTKYVLQKAKDYLKDTGELQANMPISIVDSVIEYATEQCHFPKNYTEKQIVEVLQKNKNALAMACNDVYAKAGAEGQSSHSENGVSRSYDSSWISPKLFSGLPNYVTIL